MLVIHLYSYETIDKYLEMDIKKNNFLEKDIGNENFKFNSIGFKSQKKSFVKPIIRTEATELVLDYENKTDSNNIHFTINNLVHQFCLILSI